MALARDLVELEARLRLRGDVDVFSSTERSRLLAIAEFEAVSRRVDSTDPVSVTRLCLQALRIQHSELSPKLLDAELVATLPPETPGLARPTERVVHEMVSRATKEVILVGYEFTELTLVQHLANASSRGATVIMICDRSRGGAERVRVGWPQGARLPRIFQDRVRADSAPYASMHAKCLLVDGKELLITSANFTFHGLRGNIEVGVRLGGAPAAEARKIFSHLVENRIVEELIEGEGS